ncbi:hypothetical protein [Aeromicrobium piscarium]|uniref:Uncharacterized protein n=1 Tax=Aeromicrobium piscarium TaxID=2590901 RepID=A0A554S8A6_9ACTN|nr:hypothetical protein [Aeromicrobium piscarium]TSD62590.1 hypothetical protein FNM00_11585 [Aeromicrobium piscarium]
MHSMKVRTLWPILGLLVLAPISAEYLSGYLGQRLADLPGIVVSLVILAPLYGVPALLIREFARRTGRGWPSMIALAAAFGVVQAALIDRSLFDPGYFDDSDFWQELPTPFLGVDISQLLVFVVGHVIWSFCAPIAIVESASPRTRDRPWLTWWGAALGIVAYLLAAAAIATESSYLPTPLEAGAVAIALIACVALAWLAPRPGRERSGASPSLTVTALTALALLAVYSTASAPEPGPWAWPSVGVAAIVLLLIAWLASRWSSRAGWDQRHVAVVASAPLIVYSLQTFFLPPADDPTAKYATNVVQLIAVIALAAWGIRRAERGVAA